MVNCKAFILRELDGCLFELAVGEVRKEGTTSVRVVSK